MTNFKIVSAIRCEIASVLNIDQLQEVLSAYWKPYMKNLQVHLTDATCYESYIRYPTDIKFLWEAISWLYPHMCSIYKSLKLKKPKSKFKKQSQRYLGYSRKRKRRKVETQVLKRSLLHLLNKLIGLTDHVIKQYSKQERISPGFHKRYAVIRQVLTQQ